jgi:hypothetical protein
MWQRDIDCYIVIGARDDSEKEEVCIDWPPGYLPGEQSVTPTDTNFIHVPSVVLLTTLRFVWRKGYGDLHPITEGDVVELWFSQW